MNKEGLINSIIYDLSLALGNKELKMVENVIRKNLHNVNVQDECTAVSTYSDDNEYILNVFVANKRLENASDKSIAQYVAATKHMLDTINKNYKDVSTNDIKYYLSCYQSSRRVSPNTLANIKRFISRFRRVRTTWILENAKRLLVYKLTL